MKNIYSNTVLKIAAVLMTSFSIANAQSTFSFNTCGATGSVGPTQIQVNNSYSLTNLNGSVTSVGGIQNFTVPVTSSYSLVAAGAGAGSANNFGGRGRIVSGVMTLTQGTVLQILVGQSGICTNTASQSSGGGGGCFIVSSPTTPLLVGGGGGGFLSQVFSAVPQSDGNDVPSGYNSVCNSGTGGMNGNGGTGSNNGWGGGGGGYSGNGTAAINCANTGGISFTNGGLGAGTCNNAPGGFGGGGGTHGNTGGGGGGGGYSGGGGSNQSLNPNAGGGGGSYFNGALTNTTLVGFNTGQGYAYIIQLCNNTPPAPTDITNVNNYTACTMGTTTLAASGAGTLTWHASDVSPAVVGSGSTFVTPPSAPGTYTYWAMTTNTCSSGPRTPITFTVIPPPSVTIGSNVAICQGYSVNLSASGATSYTWNTGATTSTISSPAVSQFTVIGFDAVTGCTASAVSDLTLSPSPTLMVTGPSSVCAGTKTVLTVSGANQYFWTNNSSTLSAINATINNNVSYTVVGTFTANGCSTRVQHPVISYPLPVLNTTGNNTITCPNFSTGITVTGAAGYFWSTGATTPSVVFSPNTNTTYSVVGVSNAGCTNTLVVNIYYIECVGLNENLANDYFHVYPIPATTGLVIETSKEIQRDLEIIDLTGRSVQKLQSQQARIEMDISELPEGIYFLKIHEEGSEYVRKIIKR
jgi:hypothetical protein